MRIGIFTDWFSPSVGGTESATQSHCEMIEKSGGTAIVFAPSFRGQKRNEPANIVRIPALPTVLGENNNRAMLIYPGLLRSIRRYGLDIVHSETPLSAGLLADMVARDQSIPHIHTIHGLSPAQVPYYPFASSIIVPLAAGTIGSYRAKTGRRRAMSQRVDVKVAGLMQSAWRSLLAFANLADVVTVPGRSAAARIHAMGLRKAPVVLPNAIETALFRPQGPLLRHNETNRPLRIVSIGRVAPEKRTSLLIQAAAKLPFDISWQVVVAGVGPDILHCRRVAKRLGVEDKVCFVGAVSRRETIRLLGVSDIFALCSYGFDNHPMATLEAMSAGLPVVYCDPQLQNELGTSGALCAGDSLQGFAEALTQLAKDAERRNAMSASAIEESNRFDIQTIRHQLWGVYKSAMVRTQGVPPL